MSRTLFDFMSYRDYLKAKLGIHGSQDRTPKGRLKELAQATQCQTSYLSRVLKGDADLSLEQASFLSEHFQLTELEMEYFLLLIQKERAGTRKLQQWFEAKLKKFRADAGEKKIRQKLAVDAKLSERFQSQYYSSWFYTAVHAASDVKKYQKNETLAQALDISIDQLDRILTDLEKMGLIKRNGPNSFTQGTGSIHLDRHAPWQLAYQLSWRMMALRALEKKTTSDLNYTAVISHSKADRDKIENIFHTALSELADVVRASPPEEVSCINLDFFRPFRD